MPLPMLAVSSFREQMEQLADEYERLYDELDRVEVENSDLKLDLEKTMMVRAHDSMVHRLSATPEATGTMMREDFMNPIGHLHTEKPVVIDSLDPDGLVVEVSDFAPTEEDAAVASDIVGPADLHEPPSERFVGSVVKKASMDLLSAELVSIRKIPTYFSMPSCSITLAPLGPFRLTWDVLAIVVLLLEVWLVPFDHIFLADVAEPDYLPPSYGGLSIFFLVDIVFGFVTGYISLQDEEVRLCRQVVRHYLLGWFWVDLVATVPGCVWIFMGNPEDLQLLNYFRLVRLFRLARARDYLLRGMRKFQASTRMMNLAKVVQLLLCIALFTHCHGCLWASLQPDWTRTTEQTDALRHYLESFRWAYAALTVGALRSTTGASKPSLWALEMFIASERLVIVALICRFAVRYLLAHGAVTQVAMPGMPSLSPGLDASPRSGLGENGSLEKRGSQVFFDPVESSNLAFTRHLQSMGLGDLLDLRPLEDLNMDTESDEELDAPPPRFHHGRRMGVSAEACGAFNIVFEETKNNEQGDDSVASAEWAEEFSKAWMQGKPTTALLAGNKPKRRHTPQEWETLGACLKRLPFLYNVQGPGIDAIVNTMDIDRHSAGDHIYTKGEFGKSAFVLISGQAAAFTDRLPEPGQKRVRPTRTLEKGVFFGEYTMLWGFPRESTVIAQTDVTVGKLSRDNFFRLVTQHEMDKSTQKQSILRKVRLFEMLNDEMVCKVVDVLERRAYPAGTKIIEQGTHGTDLFFLWDGMCILTRNSVAEVVPSKRDSCVNHAGSNHYDSQSEMRRIAIGDCFGHNYYTTRDTRRAATVTALGKVKVLVLTAKKFVRLFGSFQQVRVQSLLHDPRSAIADFFRPGDQRGPYGLTTTTRLTLSEEFVHHTDWFAVFRPTSRDAIAKLIDGTAVGKGFNIKGKSAKMNHLSGYVPFLQIHDNNHKDEIEDSPPWSRTTIYYPSKWARALAHKALAVYLDPSYDLDIDEPREITEDNSYHDAFGLNLPEVVLREAYIVQVDISHRRGGDTGRPSEPTYMDMNLHSIREKAEPRVVIYQFDQLDPMNPHGLLMAYAEASVKPVVSDFDLFTIGSRGMEYAMLDPLQQQIAVFLLHNARQILLNPLPGKTWTSMWIETQREWQHKGLHPEMPKYGFGDRTSVRLVEALVQKTADSGAVRHGAECFNYYFPQELDSEYLVVWDGFQDGRWSYMNEPDMREFLTFRASEGYSFPINPVWPIRDKGWYELFMVLKQSKEIGCTFDRWFPPSSGLRDKIDRLHKETCHNIGKRKFSIKQGPVTQRRRREVTG